MRGVPSAGSPGNQWANQMSVPPVTGNLPVPLTVKTAAFSCPPSASHGGVSLQDLASNTQASPYVRSLMGWLWAPSSVSGLLLQSQSWARAGLQGAAYHCQQSPKPWYHLTNCRPDTVALGQRAHSWDSTGPNNDRTSSKLLIRYWSPSQTHFGNNSQSGLVSAVEFSSALKEEKKKPLINTEQEERKWFIRSFNKYLWSIFLVDPAW